MKRELILIVDSDHQFVDEVSKSLESDFEISIAFSSQDGFSKARAECPSLVLLGYLEPRGDSFNLHQELREELSTKPIPILVVDVRPGEHSRKGWRKHEGLQMDAEGYMSRPISPEDLKNEITRILDSNSLRMLEWRKVLEQTEKSLVQEAAGWNSMVRGFLANTSRQGERSNGKAKRKAISQPAC